MALLLNPKLSEMGLFFCMILVVYLGHVLFLSERCIFFSNQCFALEMS